jgi:2-polyprenyl-6-methoxyphenol hydroxylase-like FAD-dependent oxidoreductase
MPLNVLIVGAGVCGPALAILLQGSKLSHKITVVERFPALRAAGQQIDVKNQGVEILKRMNLLDTVKSHRVNETGIEVLDSKGKAMTVFGASPSDRQGPGLTSEYEIMRGDMVKILYEASLRQDAELGKEPGKEGGLTYEFGKTVTGLAQTSDGAEVTFSDGQKRRYDLVVGADGQGSKTRSLAFGQEISTAAFNPSGLHAAYYSIPRIDGEGEHARAYSAAGSRLIITRTGDRPVTQVMLFTTKNAERLRRTYKEQTEKQKQAFAEVFRDAGWQADRLVSGMTACDDFYAFEVGQIRMEQLHTGRVVLLGDAGYGASPNGMGITSSLIGAYVLAGELARHGSDVAGALAAYQATMRQPIKECQRLPSSTVLGVMLPSSQLGVWMLRNTLWAVSKASQITSRLGAEDNSGWSLPEYSELNLKS